MTIIASIPHTHLVGNEIWTKIIRNGSDIGYLFRNQNYDFNYQNNYLLSPFVNITKDDALVTYCGYNTQKRTDFTFAGHKTVTEVSKYLLNASTLKDNLKYKI